MAATITYSNANPGQRITISGVYKGFTGTSTTTVVTYSAGEAPAAGDVGRFILWCRGGTTNTGPWEVRRITAATATTVTVHDPWTATPSNGDTFRISSTADDILAADATAGTKTGDSTFNFNGDLYLTSTAFFGAADQALSFVRNVTTAVNNMMLFDNNCVFQLGQLWGGENTTTSYETTNGCRLSIRIDAANSVTYNVLSTNTSRSSSGPVVNLYGTLIESSKTGAGTTSTMFIRYPGPARNIGCILDGIMGGRVTHESSELVDCRYSGNDSATVATSIGVTMTRNPSGLKFFQNASCLKTFSTFTGTVRDSIFGSSNTYFLRIEGSAGNILSFIDCTEIPDAKIDDAGAGVVNQNRSVNLTTTTADGSALGSVAIRINNKDDTTQGAVTISNASTGVAAEILALRSVWTDANPQVSYAPFRIRLRKYGYRFVSLNSSIADPIKQTTALIVDTDVTDISGAAAAYTGITLTDHGGSPVSWNGKNFGITVTGNLTTNPSLTLSNIKHYLHYHLSQNASIGGKSSGLLWHNLIPMDGTKTENGIYGSVTKGVRVIDENGNPFPEVTRMQSDDGTYLNFTPVVQSTASISGFTSGSRVIVYNVTEDNEVYNDIISGSSWNFSYTDGTSGAFTNGDLVDVFHLYYQPDGSYATKKTKTRTQATTDGWSVLINEEECITYTTYYTTFGETGEQIYNTGEFSYDGPNIEINVEISGSSVSWYAHKMYLWDKYALWYEGNRDFFTKITSTDPANISISDMLLDNIASPSKNYVQEDIIRVSRTDETYPVKNPSTGGGGIDVIWRQPVLQTSTSGITPSEVQIKQWVREELNTEMIKIGKIDKVTKLIPASL